MMKSWQDISAALGFDAEAFAHREIVPNLGAPSAAAPDKPDYAKALRTPMTIASGLFFASFILVQMILPDGFFSILLTVILFPFLFFSSLAGVFWFYRDRILELISGAEASFLRRSAALKRMAAKVGLSYVPAPGGAPEALKKLAGVSFIRQRLGGLAELLDSQGGLDGAIRIARQSGVATPNVLLLGTAENRQAALRQQESVQVFQDGFTGARHGIAFKAFEWSEPVDEDERLYHLVIVLSAPFRLQSVTELRSPGITWPKTGRDHGFGKVTLGPRAFDEKFDVRSTDQTEARALFNPAVMERLIAFADDDKLRAAAFDDHLVIGLRGHNRFELVSISTGAWTEDTLQQTFSDIAELTALVDALAHAFMLRRGAGPKP